MRNRWDDEVDSFYFKTACIKTSSLIRSIIFNHKKANTVNGR